MIDSVPDGLQRFRQGERAATMSTHRIHIEALRAVLPTGSEALLSADEDADPVCVTIEGDEFRHAAKAKRRRVGDSVVLFDGRGLVARGIVTTIGSRAMTVTVQRAREVGRLRPEIVMAVPPPKGTKPEVMVDQLSQVGVGVWVPLITERTIVKPRDGKQERWGRVAVESAKQSGRSWVMEITEPVPVSEFGAWVAREYGTGPDVLFVVADPMGTKPREIMGQAGFSADRIVMVVGPEGGLSPGDDAVIESWGKPVVRLRVAPHVLRVGTAAVVAASIGRAVLWGGA
ncbi:MAG: 16S rRNA (uracil(1498)-N(3))-methyltransferase [Planctomycetes bacterium]|nr:16S rRNA (uracil(1498)-N(3))-methyltransferase [Planctomycetota bacterium]